jgi:hypothetical protein
MSELIERWIWGFHGGEGSTMWSYGLCQRVVQNVSVNVLEEPAGIILIFLWNVGTHLADYKTGLELRTQNMELRKCARCLTRGGRSRVCRRRRNRQQELGTWNYLLWRRNGVFVACNLLKPKQMAFVSYFSLRGYVNCKGRVLIAGI